MANRRCYLLLLLLVLVLVVVVVLLLLLLLPLAVFLPVASCTWGQHGERTQGGMVCLFVSPSPPIN
jgi:hypothetical protein